MCRLAAYLGTEISLSMFLQEHEHSLVKQSWAPKEMQSGILNADGYGVAWLADGKVPSSYKNILPIWSDANLDSLGRSLTSHLWLANVRSATIGQGISMANTQPFIKDDMIFIHNGSLAPFDRHIKANLRALMPDLICAEINGDSDSLYLFALLQHHLQNQSALADAIIALLGDLAAVCGAMCAALLNIIVSDGKTLYVCCHALNGDCPSLYYQFNNRGIWIASEPLSPNDEWIKFPEHSLMLCSHSAVLKTYTL